MKVDLARARRPSVLVFFAFVCALAAVTWPLLAPDRILVTDDGFVSDVTMAGLPFRSVLQRALAGSASLFWCPGIYSGFPLHAVPEAGFYYPPNWILAVTGSAASAVHLSLFLHLVVAGLGVLFLLRRERMPAPARFFAALAFAAGGFMLAHLKHVAMVSVAAWLPWIVAGALDIAASGGRKRAPFLQTGLAAAMMGLAGHPQLAYIGLLAALSFWFCSTVIPGRDADPEPRGGGGPRRPGSGHGWVRAGIVLGAALLAGNLVAAVAHLPAYIMVRSSTRAELSGHEFAEQLPLEPRNLASWIHPRAVGMAGDGTYRGRGLHWEDYSYQGLAAVPLALIGLLAHFRRRTVRVFALGGLIALVLALGARGGLYSIAIAVVPGLSWFRFPARFLVVTELAVAVLAAHGVAWIVTQLAARGHHGLVARLPLAIALLLVLDLSWAQRPLNGYASRAAWFEPPATVGDIPSGARYLSLGAREAHVFAYDLARGWADVAPLVVQRRFLQPSLNLHFGVHAADGYANPVPAAIARLWGDHYAPGFFATSFRVEQDGQVSLSPLFFTLARLAEVQTILSLWPLSAPELTPLAARPPVFSYALSAPRPHAWFVARAVRAASPAAAAERLQAPDFDPARETVILASLGAPLAGSDGSPPNLAGERVGIARRSDSELVLVVEAPVRGYVRVAESFDPGWSATVDGKPAPVYCADLSFQAVPVDAGRHEVRLRYRARGLVLGVALATVGLCGLLGGGLFAKWGEAS